MPWSLIVSRGPLPVPHWSLSGTGDWSRLGAVWATITGLETRGWWGQQRRGPRLVLPDAFGADIPVAGEPTQEPCLLGVDGQVPGFTPLVGRNWGCCCCSHLSLETVVDTAEFHMISPREGLWEEWQGEKKGRSSTRGKGGGQERKAPAL